jgi:hypothetical protein
MAEISFGIEHDIHGRLVTCQRPIVFSVRCNDIRAVHFKAEMMIKNKDGDWIQTGVIVKGYHESDFKIFSFNVSEYVRNYFEVGENWFNQLACVVDDALLPYSSSQQKFQFQRDFYFRIWPVYNDGFGNIVEEEDNTRDTREFGVLELNTKNNEMTCLDYRNKTRIDVWVNGTADGAYYDNTFGEIDYLGAKYNRFLSNMPGITQLDEPDNPGPYNHIDINDGWFCNFINQGWNFQSNKYQRDIYRFRNATTGAWATYNLDTVYGNPYAFAAQTTPATEIYYTCLNLQLVEWLINFAYGTGNYLIDASGNLLVDRMEVTTQTRTASALYRGGPKITLDIKKGDTKCGKRTKFVFKNMRGGIDWFHCYGTKKKSIGLEQTTYEQNQRFDRGAGQHFGVSLGEHSTTNLWTERKEKISVFSQPLRTDWAIWLEELVVSPQVWIEEEVEHNYSDLPWPRNRQLVPIIIDKGSFKIYSTEDNVHYIEFKYELSDNTLTQVGY